MFTYCGTVEHTPSQWHPTHSAEAAE